MTILKIDESEFSILLGLKFMDLINDFNSSARDFLPQDKRSIIIEKAIVHVLFSFVMNVAIPGKERESLDAMCHSVFLVLDSHLESKRKAMH